MSDMKRHVGRLNNTGQRIVVVFMQLPNDPEHALVIPTDTLPLKYENALMALLESPEGQNEENLSSLLGRRPMIDSTKSVLQAFHEAGLMQRIPIDNITMLPKANMPFALRYVLEQMGRLGEKPTEMDKYNPFAAQAAALSDEDKKTMANNLLIEAGLLETEALKKREQAYTYVPELRTNVQPTVVQSDIKKVSRPRTTKPKTVKKTVAK